MKKKSLILIVLIIIMLIIIASGSIAAVYFFTDLLKGNDQLFAKYLLQNANLSSIFVSENLESQKELKDNNSYTSEGELLIDIQKGNENKVIQIATNSQYDKNTQRSFSQSTLKNGEQDLLNISFINSADIYAIKCEDVYEHYIGIQNANLKEFASKMELDEEVIQVLPNIISFTQENAEETEVITDEESKYLSETYLKVLLQSISKEKFTKVEKSTITIQDITTEQRNDFEVRGYSLKLNQEDVKQILVNILTKAKDDTSTLNIIRKIMLEQQEISEEDLIASIEELIMRLESEFKQEFEIEIIVYQSKGKTIRTQINYNNQSIVKLDVANNEKNYKKIIIEIGDNLNGTQIIIDKNITDNSIIHTQKVCMVQEEIKYLISMDTILGNVNGNSINNQSNIEIIDGNNTINVSYNKNLQTVNEQVQILELTGSNTVITNNYTKEQLDKFFETIGNRYAETLNSVATNLNLTFTNENDIFNLIDGVAGSIIAVVNVNGAEPAVSTASTVIYRAIVNNVKSLYNLNKLYDNAQNSMADMERLNLNDKVIDIQSRIMVEAYSQGTMNANIIKTIIEEVIGENYTIIGSQGLTYNSDNKKLNGTITITNSSSTKYILNFTNNTVTKQ